MMMDRNQLAQSNGFDEISSKSPKGKCDPGNNSRMFLQLLGEKVEVDKWLDWRVHYGQRAGAIFGAASMITYVINTLLYDNESIFLVASSFFSAIGMFVSLATIYFRNISSAIFCRLLREVNVVIILVLAVCNFIIDLVKPYNEFSAFNGFIYLLGITVFLFLDSVKKKSRVFVLTIGSMFVFATLVEVYFYSFVDWEIGVVLFQHGNQFLFRKRSIKRSIFVQIFTFSLNGLRTMLKDKKMEMMMFATGNLYRKTGTSSQYFSDKEHVMRLEGGAGEKSMV